MLMYHYTNQQKTVIISILCTYCYEYVLTLFLSGWGLYDPTFGMMKMQTQLCVAFYLLYCLIFSLFSDE